MKKETEGTSQTRPSETWAGGGCSWTLKKNPEQHRMQLQRTRHSEPNRIVKVEISLQRHLQDLKNV